LYLHASQTSLKSKLLNIAHNKYQIYNLKMKTVGLAVVSDSTGPGPVYSFSKNFPEEQALEVRWVLKMETQGPAAHFLPVSSRFNQSCSTSINHKEEEWPTVMRKVSSLSKL
jgi:hypothetical protein